jgi:hypothetical protein
MPAAHLRIHRSPIVTTSPHRFARKHDRIGRLNRQRTDPIASATQYPIDTHTEIGPRITILQTRQRWRQMWRDIRTILR